ncbi:MAG: type II toxin-antitoxin system HicA family toxin [Acidobacteria bacterium]|nr:type II toxin-antitoxin system HicA family toxin [Acidobacteriota bacterium]
MKVRDLIELLADHGWVLQRQRGSHRQFKNAGSMYVITVAGQTGEDVPAGTLNKILRDAGLKKNLGKSPREQA